MGPSASPVEITVRGEDLVILQQVGDSLVNTVKEVKGVRNVKNSLEETRPEMLMVVDREKAARYGLSASQILSSVLTSFNGQVVSGNTSYGIFIKIFLDFFHEHIEVPSVKWL